MDFQRHTWPFFPIALCAIFIACGDDNSSGASANLKNRPIADSTIQKTADVSSKIGDSSRLSEQAISMFSRMTASFSLWKKSARIYAGF